MRTEKEIMRQILGFAEADERVRLVGMEGSRTNPNVPKDRFRDYDISFLVTELASFQQNDAWLDRFGPRAMMQKPEAMALFPPELGNWFSYLILFEDGNKLDLTLIPLSELSAYLASDRLLKILLDKDGMAPPLPEPTDADYWIRRPSAAFFDDCCNEFWMTSTCIVKGLCRGELPYAAYHMEAIVRPQLLTMLSWKIGAETSFDYSLGKHYKFIRRYLTESEWSLLAKTYRMDTTEACRSALTAASQLFAAVSRTVAQRLGFLYPDYERKVTAYVRRMWEEERRAGNDTEEGDC